MSERIRIRRDLAATWQLVNPILGEAEPGYESDTGKLKIGDGFNNWNDLVYFAEDRFEAFRDSRRIYISPDGNDNNNGTSLGEPLRTFAAAAAAAQPGDLIQPGPGIYVEELLPIRWRRNVGILCSGLRNTILRPAAGQEFRDIFHVDSGFWIWGMQFAGHQADGPTGRQSWAIAFDPLADNRDIGAIGLGAFILQSPYIQNCSSITAEDDAGLAGSQSTGDSGGGILVDGRRCAANSPIRSMVVDSYTQVNLGGPGCLVVNDGYAQLVSFFGTFCTYHVRTESGGQVNLSGGGTSDFGTYGLMADGYSPTPLFTGQARAAAFGALRIEKSITIDPAANTLSGTAHGLSAGDQVSFKVSNGTLPAPLNTTATFHVISDGLTADGFKVSATPGGAAIDISGSASGSYQVVRQGVTAVDVIGLSANRLGRQLKYPSTGALGAQGRPVTISAVASGSFTVTLDPVAGIVHTYVGGGKVTQGGVDYPITSCSYNNASGVTTLRATGFSPMVGQSVTLSGLSFICNSASRPNAGQLMFPQLVFPRNASSGAAEAKTYAFTRTGTNTLTVTEAAAPNGPDHEYVSGGSAVVSGTDLGVVDAVYDKATGEVVLTTALPVPAASGSVTLNGLAFICPASAYVVTSSVPINASGVEVANNDPAKAGYRVYFYNEVNGGLLNSLAIGQVLDFRNRSQISAPGHTFEYVGSGTNYNALPSNGGVPVPGNKIVETNNGRVYSSNTDELGNFAVGSQFSVDGTTGAVTISTDQFNLSGLNFIGPFSRNGGFSSVGVQLQEVSNNTSLIASTGAPDANTVPTQFAVKEFTGSRYITSVIAAAGQPITISGAAEVDGNGNWIYVRTISLSLNVAGGLAQLDGGGLVPRNLLPPATTSLPGALAASDKVKLDSLGSAAYAASTAFANAAQGALADTAIQPAALSTALSSKADLVGGKVPTAQIPAIAITEYLGDVNSQTEMLALTGQRGDWCLRTDGNNRGQWVLSGDDASQLGNWVQIITPVSSVQSVNGQTGAVTLGPGDVGAATAAQGAKADSAIQPGNAALSDAREWSAETISQAEAEAGSATTRRAFTAQRVFQAAAAWWAGSDAKAKLDGIASGATANATDAQLRDRSTHTGTQSASTITGLATVATSGAYADLSGRPTLGTAAAANTGTSAGNVPVLDGAGLVPSALLPGFVDDVLEFANMAAFPATGEAGKLYISLATNRQYRWSGSTYVEINPSPGSTDAVPEGSVNLYFTAGRAAAAAPVQSVAGRTGSVTLSVGDVSGAVGTNDARLTDSREWNADTISQNEAETGTGTTRRAFTALRVRQAIAAWWSTITTISLPAGSAPSTPATGFALFANASNALSWIGANGFTRTFDGTANTANRTYTLPNASGTVALASDIPGIATTSTAGLMRPVDLGDVIVLACSDETTDLATGTARVTFRMPWAATLTAVRLSVNTAPTGSALIADVNEAGVSVFSTRPQIDAGARTSVGSSVTPVISDSALAADAEITVGIDQVGSTIKGKGLKVALYVTRVQP